jgi:hypothetical protein
MRNMLLYFWIFRSAFCDPTAQSAGLAIDKFCFVPKSWVLYKNW